MDELIEIPKKNPGVLFHDNVQIDFDVSRPDHSRKPRWGCFFFDVLNVIHVDPDSERCQLLFTSQEKSFFLPFRKSGFCEPDTWGVIFLQFDEEFVFSGWKFPAILKGFILGSQPISARKSGGKGEGSVLDFLERNLSEVTDFLSRKRRPDNHRLALVQPYWFSLPKTTR